MSAVRALTAVFEREVRERRLLLVAALVVGLAPLLMPLLPRTSVGTSEMRSATALVLAGVFSAVIALLLGASVIARDLAEQRISFYFSRPLPGWTIWAGKLAAAAALTLGGGALILLPALLVGDRVDPSGHWHWLSRMSLDSGETFLMVAAWLLILLLIGHVAGVMLRSRSPWLILDIVALLAAGWLLLDSFHSLDLVGARSAFALLSTSAFCIIPLALLAAGAVQVIRGRTDLRRSHRLLSLTLWGILLSLAFVSQGFSRWVTAVTPQHLEAVEIAIPAPAGDWAYVEGRARHRGDYSAAFLLNTSNGQSIEVPPDRVTRWGLRLSFSGDGRRVAWTYWNPGGNVRVDTVDLTRPEAGVVQTAISFDWYIDDFALSPDGSRLATLSRGRLRVDEFPSGKMLASVRLPWEQVESARLLFEGDVIRLQAVRIEKAIKTYKPQALERTLYLYEYDLSTRELVQTGELRFTSLVWDLATQDDNERIVLRNRETSSFQIYDARTGELRMSTPIHPESTVRSVLLTGDRLALAVQRRGQPSQLLVLAGDGTPLRRLRFAGSLLFGGQPTPGTLVVASGSPERPGTSWLLDLDTGGVKRIGDGLLPLAWVDLQTGSTGTRLFSRTEGQLVWLDPLTGQQRVVLPRRG